MGGAAVTSCLARMLAMSYVNNVTSLQPEIKLCVLVGLQKFSLHNSKEEPSVVLST